MKKKNKKALIIRIIIAVLIVALAAGYFIYKNKAKNKPVPVYGKVTRQTIINSVSCDGVITPVTTVEIKSNVGGTIVKLHADEGDYVRQGQLLAEIDPVDVLTALEKEKNSLTSAKARLSSAENNLAISQKSVYADLDSARENVRSAEARLAQAQKEAQLQPALSKNEIDTARANLDSAKSDLEQLKTSSAATRKASAKSSYESAKASFDQAENKYERNKGLLEKGYISKQDFDTIEQAYLSAKASYENAKVSYDEINNQLAEDIRVAENRVTQAQKSYDTAVKNKAQIEIKNHAVVSAEAALNQAKASLTTAQANLKNIDSRRSDVADAKASVSSAESSVYNAETNYNYTKITAPRSGIITKKWTEEGSIIMAGKASTAGSSSGVVIFEIADTTKMMVSVDVDETDISQISMGMYVDIAVDAFPEEKFTGTVSRIAASAETNSGVTTVPVEVTINEANTRIKPEMNASCEFIVQKRENVLVLPEDYIQTNFDGSTAVMVMKDKKPVQQKVELGIFGDDMVEITSGVTEGMQVVLPKSLEVQKMPSRGMGRPPF